MLPHPSRGPAGLLVCLFSLLTFPAVIQAQPVRNLDAARIHLELEKLQHVGGVLYIAAHPDDENTALLAWLARGRRVDAAYLAITRGDGGQNLIGPELGDRLGLIRTHELLEARRIDGARQFFTRAKDFGYSKSTEEALSVWGHQEILSDVVRVVRTFRPDVIITRFSPSRGGHGHHTASALLAREAFEAAGDPARFPDQVEELEPWQPTRLLFDSWSGGALGVDLGVYEPLLGTSFTEIAAQSRSQHKSQGFGARARRGTSTNTFAHTAGTPAREDILEGVDLSWDRIPGGGEAGRLLRQAAEDYDPRDPAQIVTGLLKALEVMEPLRGDPRVERKRTDLIEVVRACTGLWLETVGEDWRAAPGSILPVEVAAINRSGLPLRLERVELPWSADPVVFGEDLPPNREVARSVRLEVPADTPYTHPYWLREEGTAGRYAVPDPSLIGMPEAPALEAVFHLALGETAFAVPVPLLYRWTDRVEGERYREVQIAPRLPVAIADGVLFFGDDSPREVRVEVRTEGSAPAGEVRLSAPPGWTVSPPRIALHQDSAAPTQTLLFQLAPGPDAVDGVLEAAVRVDGGSGTVAVIDRGMEEISYPHLPVLTLMPAARVPLVRTDAATRGSRIGYVMGAGDPIPAALEQLGYRVDLLEDGDLTLEAFRSYDAVVTGIRAFNTRPALVAAHGDLMAYVEGGGTVVIQYNTTGGLLTREIGPHPLEIGRGRVTEEDAEVRILRPDHPLLNEPNRLGPDDFAGWVQERGLYFPGDWDASYVPLLAMNDQGEAPLEGSLLYTEHGQGVFIYTGLSLFRQIPAGVPGAWRLLANLISARQHP